MSISVSVSFFMFPCSKGHSARAYLDNIWMTLIVVLIARVFIFVFGWILNSTFERFVKENHISLIFFLSGRFSLLRIINCICSINRCMGLLFFVFFFLLELRPSWQTHNRRRCRGGRLWLELITYKLFASNIICMTTYTLYSAKKKLQNKFKSFWFSIKCTSQFL